MKAITLVYATLTILVMAVTARAADDISIERMATCQDSWLEWKKEPSKLQGIDECIRLNFTENDNSAYLVPKTEVSVFGLRIVQLFPESIGMAAGFSVIVDADFKKTRDSMEKSLKKSFKTCDTADNTLTCVIGEKKTLILLAEKTGKKVNTLIGCYYYYEK